MLSTTAEYALRAVIHLAEREGEGPVRVEDVASALGVPRNYLSKILHTLAKREILGSWRGPKGGFEMSRAASAVSLYDVVEPFDHIGERRVCLLGRPECDAECGGEHPCAVHARWEAAAREVGLLFRETTIADVAGGRARVEVILGTEGGAR